MSSAGITGSRLSLDTLLESAKTFLTDFKKIGTDLESGNTSAAAQDFVTLSQEALASPLASPSNNSSAQAEQAPLVQDFQTLRQDLKSGDLSGASKAYAQVVQDSAPSGENGTILNASA